MSARKLVNDDELEENWAKDEVVCSDAEDALDVDSDEEEEAEEMSKKRPRDAEQETSQPNPKKKKFQLPIHKMNQLALYKWFSELFHLQGKSKHKKKQIEDAEINSPFEVDHFAEVDVTFGKHTLPSLGRFIRYILPSWKKDFKAKNADVVNSPKIIFVCSSALGAVELLRYLGEFQCHIAKLFSKHIKANEQVEMLRSYHPIAVGTPNRLKKLIEMGGLSLQSTSHVIIDMRRDKKDYNIMELNDQSKDVSALINEHFLPCLRNNTMKLALY